MAPILYTNHQTFNVEIAVLTDLLVNLRFLAGVACIPMPSPLLPAFSTSKPDPLLPTLLTLC